MKKILKDIFKYSQEHGFTVGLSLIIENDGSGVLTDNPYANGLTGIHFEFNSLKELNEELNK